MTCCHFYLQYQRYNETMRLELLQRQSVESGRQKHRKQPTQRVESPLHDAYYREFTGTGVMRRLEREHAQDHTPPRDTLDSQGDTEGDTALLPRLYMKLA